MLNICRWAAAGLAGLLMAIAQPAAAAEIRIDDLHIDAGQEAAAPIVVDGVDNLAGLKLALWYDQDLLRYRRCKKAAEAASLLITVNSRIPGVLTIAMAGARGIQAENLAVVTVFFDVSADAAGQKTIPFLIRESRLIDDGLNTRAHTVSVGNLEVMPSP